MKLTKKQLSALQRIVGREQTRYDEIQSEALAGVHPSEKHFAITDGTMVVLFAKQPEGIPVGDRTETYDKYVQDYLKDANASLVVSPPTVDDCKKIIRKWRGMKNLGNPLFPKITVTTKDENDAPMTSYFDAYRYLDILEAVGPYRNIYMGAATQYGLRIRACWCISGAGVTSKIVSTGMSRHFCCRAVLDRRMML